MTSAAAIAIAAALLPSVALAEAADRPVTPVAPPQQPQPAAATTQVTIIAQTAVAPADQDPPPRDRHIHGTASVAVGGHGYRQGQVTAAGPIGQSGYGSITIGAGQVAGWRP